MNCSDEHGLGSQSPEVVSQPGPSMSFWVLAGGGEDILAMITRMDQKGRGRDDTNPDPQGTGGRARIRLSNSGRERFSTARLASGNLDYCIVPCRQEPKVPSRVRSGHQG